MAWIKSHQELKNHYKTIRLAKNLKQKKATVIGYLHMLWWWAIEYAPDGNLARFTAEELADVMEWSGEPSAILESLKSSGFVDEDMSIHDWEDYAGNLIRQKQKHAQNMRMLRARDNHVTVTCQSRDEVVTSTCQSRDNHVIPLDKSILDKSIKDDIIKDDNDHDVKNYPLINSLLPFLSFVRQSFFKVPVLADSCEDSLRKLSLLTGKENFNLIIEKQINYGSNRQTLINSVNPVKDLTVIANKQIEHLIKYPMIQPEPVTIDESKCLKFAEQVEYSKLTSPEERTKYLADRGITI